MPRGDDLSSALENSPAELRHRATRVRQLARELVNEDDVSRMCTYARELEERARQADRMGPCAVR